MELPGRNSDYREKSYWDERYTTEESYDWFTGYSSFQHLLRRDILPQQHILTIGCGNSSMSTDMYENGFKHITNTDFSPVVIEKMAEKHKDLTEMSWQVMDMCDISFPAESFDIVLEKGTLDAVMVHERDPWNTSQETLDLIDSVLQQVERVLKPGGKFISITFAQPHFRRPLYARKKYGWDVNMSSVGEAFHFFYMVMEKGKQLSEKDILAEKEREKKRLLRENNSENPVTFMENDTEDFVLSIEL
ncbi:EEF1A lysine methyltransferase 4-like [Mya arenaria]|uniref:EEF1A lysine methyltransferase 4-like n=1 Tax=Mya arenaria TaxID=6604 RepID=UPI0022E69F49|nr:EEF1A lysine methyltransferase 4-like [Mya arenaria]